MKPSDVIFNPQQRETLTYGQSNSCKKSPVRVNTAI